LIQAILACCLLLTERLAAARCPVMRAAMGPATSFCDDAGRRAFLTKAAGAIARQLVDRSAPSEDDLRMPIKDVLLAECEDASSVAAARCEALRSDLAAAVRQVLAPLPSAAHLLTNCGDGAFAPCVRVEVRGTAGRTILKGCFTIGSDPYCDVHVFGDATVMPLQCLVIPLPGGLVVVDIWSGGSTHATWRRNDSDPGSPIMKTDPCAAFVMKHNERTVFRIGARTTVTLGQHSEKVAHPVLAKTVVQPGPEAEKVSGAPRECKPAVAGKMSTFSTACVTLSSCGSSSSSSTGLASRSRSRSCRRAQVGGPMAVCT